MDVYGDVAPRLAMLGYLVKAEDEPAIGYLTGKCRAELLASIHHKELPAGLYHTLVDMVAGSFLQGKLAAGALEIEGLDFSPAMKSITEGDVSITAAGASEGTPTPEARFVALLDRMAHPPERILGAYRRLKW